MRNRTTPRRMRGERASAAVEFAFIAPVFMFIMFGIISFGFLLAFAQNVTQAANEGARAGAVALAVEGEVTADLAITQARGAVESAVSSFGKSCDIDDGLTCTIVVVPCGVDPEPLCLVVSVEYDYGNNPILPEIPLMGAVYPDRITNVATAQINPSVINSPTSP